MFTLIATIVFGIWALFWERVGWLNCLVKIKFFGLFMWGLYVLYG